MTTAIIHFRQGNVYQPRPWNVALDSENVARSGLGRDVGAKLIGFGPQSAQRVTVLVDEAMADPESVVDLVPTFGDSGGMFSWNIPVRELEVKA